MTAHHLAIPKSMRKLPLSQERISWHNSGSLNICYDECLYNHHHKTNVMSQCKYRQGSRYPYRDWKQEPSKYEKRVLTASRWVPRTNYQFGQRISSHERAYARPTSFLCRQSHRTNWMAEMNWTICWCSLQFHETQLTAHTCSPSSKLGSFENLSKVTAHILQNTLFVINVQ
jgi:hypothetical protein